MNFAVYIHTSPKGKKYVGQTCNVPEYRFGKNGENYQGNKHFWSAIQKYGWNNFVHEIIKDSLTQEEADNLEKVLIEKYNTCNPEFGYNHERGGRTGPIVTDETKRKILSSLKGRKMKESVKKHVSETMKGNKHFQGKTHSEEARKRIGNAQRGKTTGSKPILCIETGQVFLSSKLVCEYLGNEKYRSAIAACCNLGKGMSHGYHWRYV